MKHRKIFVVFLIAVVHMVLAVAFLYFGYSLAGVDTSLGRFGMVLFALSFVMTFPVMFLSYLGIPTLSDIPIWENSLGDYFGGVDYPLIFLNSLLCAMVIYSLWTRLRYRN